MDRLKTLVLGLGNEILSDDGFGPAVADRCRSLTADHARVTVESASVAGFNLLDLLLGYDRVLIIDAVQTGRRPPGTLLAWPLEQSAAGRTLGGSHQADLLTTLALGRSLDYALPASISLLFVEADDLLTLHEGLTPPVAAAVDRAGEAVLRWLDSGSLTLPAAGLIESSEAHPMPSSEDGN